MTRDYFCEIAVSLASYAWAETVQVLSYNLLETDEEDILGFPHHIHIGESDTVIPGKPITALEMLAEIDG
jgi:hypothetical protein